MKPTLLLLSLVAIALISGTEAFGRSGKCARVMCPAVQPRRCRLGEEPKNCGCCGCSCHKSHFFDELDDESVGSMGCMGHKRCGDEMDDEAVGFERLPHTRPQNPTGQSIMNSIMWDEEDESVGICGRGNGCGDEMDDEEDESVGRSCKDFPMAEDCRRLRHKNLHALFSVDDEEDDAYPRSLLNKRRLRRKFKRSFNKRRRRKRTSKKAMKSNMQRNKRRRRKRTSKKAMKSNMQRIHGRPPQTLSDELDDESVGSMGCMGHKRCGDEMYYPPNHPYHEKRMWR